MKKKGEKKIQFRAWSPSSSSLCFLIVFSLYFEMWKQKRREMKTRKRPTLLIGRRTRTFLRFQWVPEFGWNSKPHRFPYLLDEFQDESATLSIHLTMCLFLFFFVLFYRFASSCQRRFRQFPSAVDALVGSSALVLRHPFPASAASSSATAAATATVVQQRSRHVASARANPRSAAAPSPFGDSRIAGQRSPPPVPSPPQRRPFVGHGRTAIRRRTQRSNLRHPGPFDGQPNLQRRRKPQRRRRQLLFRAVQPGRRRWRRRRLFRSVGTRVASQAEEDEKATQSRRSRRMPIRQKEKQRRYTTRFL